MRARAGFFYVGVFLLCLTTLVLQILQTRILSVISYYHLAFFAISMAMFGMTAGEMAFEVLRRIALASAFGMQFRSWHARGSNSPLPRTSCPGLWLSSFGRK